MFLQYAEVCKPVGILDFPLADYLYPHWLAKPHEINPLELNIHK